MVRTDGRPLDHGVPPEVVVFVWLGLGSDEITLSDSCILLTHFGEAYDPLVTKRFNARTPPLLAPPESLFAEPDTDEPPLSFSADIWTLACTVWEFFDSNALFEAFPATPELLICEHVETLGKLPARGGIGGKKRLVRRGWTEECQRESS